jgi:hypothetical protein
MISGMTTSSQTSSLTPTPDSAFSNAASSPISSETQTQSVDHPTSTRSFLVTSSTAIPLLILGTKECTGDPNAVNGKCPNEYFCNAAKKACVLLLADGDQCFEDFQCSSTYCNSGICGGEQDTPSDNNGGKIAGAAIGGVAGTAMILCGLLRWRKKSRTVGRRMNQFQNTQSFYDATTTIVPETRLSKYNFLQQMLEPQQQQQQLNSNLGFHQIPVAASERVKSRQTMQQQNYNSFRYTSSSHDVWNKEDEETLQKKSYQYI